MNQGLFETDLGRRIAILHDQEGVHFEISFDFCIRDGLKPGLMGLLCGAAQQKWSSRMIFEMVREWERLFTPSPAERFGLDNWPKYQESKKR
jgi:hypothetical protein